MTGEPSWRVKGVSYSCSSPPSQQQGFPRQRVGSCIFANSVPTVWKWGDAWMAPPEGKPPFLEDSKGQMKRLWVRGTLAPIPIWEQ